MYAVQDIFWVIQWLWQLMGFSYLSLSIWKTALNLPGFVCLVLVLSFFLNQRSKISDMHNQPWTETSSVCWSPACDSHCCVPARKVGRKGGRYHFQQNWKVHTVCWFVLSFLNEVKNGNGNKVFMRLKTQVSQWGRVQPSMHFAEGTSKQAY